MATIIRGKNPLKPHTVRYQDQGRQRERSFATAKEARDFRIKFEHDSRESIFVDPRAGSIPFTEAVSAWIDRHPGADGTKKGYRSILAAHITPAFAGRNLAQVAQDREAVQTFLLVTMPASGRPTGMVHAKAIITGTVEEAARAGRIPASHRLSDITITAAGKQAGEFIHATHAQLTAIAAGARPGLTLAVWLMRGCGLRISEVLAVRADSFRDGGRTLRLREQVTVDGREIVPHLKHRKPGEFRDIPVPAWLSAKVADHIETYGCTSYLFQGARVPFVAYAGFRDSFQRHAEKAGLPQGYSFHQLRHSFATAMLANGVQIHELSKWLGHRDINVTVNTYGHLLPDAFDRGRAALESEYAQWSQAA